MAGREPLYRDVMTWRATKNALAGLLTGLAGGLLLLGLLVIWGAALVSLARGPGGWEHAAGQPDEQAGQCVLGRAPGHDVKVQGLPAGHYAVFLPDGWGFPQV